MRGYLIINEVLKEQYGGRMGGPYKVGPVGKCICPKCKTVIDKVRAVRCIDTKCPKCGTLMVRHLPVQK